VKSAAADLVLFLNHTSFADAYFSTPDDHEHDLSPTNRNLSFLSAIGLFLRLLAPRDSFGQYSPFHLELLTQSTKLLEVDASVRRLRSLVVFRLNWTTTPFPLFCEDVGIEEAFS